MTKIEQMQYMAENWEDSSKSVTFSFNSYGDIVCEEKHGCRNCKFFDEPAYPISCLPRVTKEEFKECHPELFI